MRFVVQVRVQYDTSDGDDGEVIELGEHLECAAEGSAAIHAYSSRCFFCTGHHPASDVQLLGRWIFGEELAVAQLERPDREYRKPVGLPFDRSTPARCRPQKS